MAVDVVARVQVAVVAVAVTLVHVMWTSSADAGAMRTDVTSPRSVPVKVTVLPLPQAPASSTAQVALVTVAAAEAAGRAASRVARSRERRTVLRTAQWQGRPSPRREGRQDSIVERRAGEELQNKGGTEWLLQC